MSGPQRSSWRPLPGVEVPGIPGLLVSTDFAAQSYTVHLTDLANLWTESLDKKPIIMRGLKEDTSIDPTDGPDQIRKLLDLVRAAFDPSAPEHGDTTLTLSQASGSTETSGDSGLVIHVSVVLPKPLRPLKWPIYLEKLPQSAIATELVLPLIHSHQARIREVEELIATLREKDGVITKLADKLEATGTGLEHVFTALSGRRKVNRAMAEERIKGFAPFKESDFRKRSATAHKEAEAPDDVAALLDSVFGGGTGLPSGSALDIGQSPALDDWWTKIGKGKSVALVSRGKDKASAFSSKANSQPAPTPGTPAKPAAEDEETQDEDDDDDFQVQAAPPSRRPDHSNTRTTQPQDDDEPGDSEPQATPPSRKRDRDTRATRILDDDDETSDGEDAEIPESPPPAPTTTAGPKSSSKRLGAIGGKKKQPPTKQKTPSPPPPRRRSPTPPSPPATRAHPVPAQDDDDDDDSATASDPDPDGDEEMPASPPPPPPPKRGGGIGRIGGRARKEAAPPRAATPERAPPGPASSSPPRPAASQQQTPKRRVGVIGKRAAPGGGAERGRGRTRTPVDDGGGGEGKEEEEEEEEKRETSRERADRVRAELQRELDRKASAAPAKKKRKF